MSKLTAAYLAGLFDGDGWLGLYWRESANCYGYEITLASATKEIIDWLENSFGGYVRTVEPGGNCKKQYWWILYKRLQIVKMLRKMRPYMRIKKEQATIMLRFLKTFESPDWHYERNEKGQIKSKTLPKKIVELRKKLHKRIKELNHRGKK